MSIDPIEFSRRGDEVFARLAARFPTAAQQRLAIDHTFEADRFTAIRAAMLGYVSRCLGARRPLSEAEAVAGLLEQRETIPNLRADGLLVPKRDHVVEFNLLHKAVADAFRDLSIEESVDVIDLPINVRVVYGKPGARRNLAFSSSKLHSDVWAGVPVDAVVVVLPVLGAIEDITIILGELPREQELEAMRAMDDYLDGKAYKITTPYTGAMQHGHAYLADVRALHQTVRHKAEGVRVSIDFRFRYSDRAYREMAPVVHGPESGDRRVSYAEWLGIGSDRLIVFDEPVSRASERAPDADDRPFGLPYRTIALE
jgi:hypothetical protein